MIWRDEDRECHCRIDSPPPDQDAGLNAHDRKVLADVPTYGWHVVDIRDDEVTQGWAFSVGMWHSFGSPELAVFGLPTPHRGHLINDLGKKVGAGLSIGPDVVVEDVLEEGRVVGFRPAHSTWYGPLFGYATWFAQQPPLPIVQVVWADPNGLFPWDDGVDPSLRTLQPSIWMPRDEHPVSAWSKAGDEGWTFPARPTATAFTTVRVAEEGAPITYVFHDHDDEWQFIDPAPWVQADIRISHLAHIVDADPTLAGIGDLPRGWQASRETVGGAWTRSPMATPEEEKTSAATKQSRWPWPRRS